MSFDLGRFFTDVFNPKKGEVITVMHDVPHGNIKTNKNWDERIEMARDWHRQLTGMADRWGVKVNPLVVYKATGGNNADLPTTAKMGDKEVSIDAIVKESHVIVVMPEFSATAPLYMAAKKDGNLRVGSMPGVARFMEKSGLAADYKRIRNVCAKLAPIFERAEGVEVEFSSGHKCYFDVKPNHAHIDDGFLHTETAGTEKCLSNLPAGEVYIVPNEENNSGTKGEVPIDLDGEVAVCVLKNNKIVETKGEGAKVAALRANFEKDPAWCNIAEVAIGCNEKARVTGIVLEDEKAGFHWAYGRSDHFGGKIGVKDFLSPSNVIHQDTVYAKDSPITCSKLDMIFADGSRQTLIVDGELKV